MHANFFKLKKNIYYAILVLSSKLKKTHTSSNTITAIFFEEKMWNFLAFFSFLYFKFPKIKKKILNIDQNKKFVAFTNC